MDPNVKVLMDSTKCTETEAQSVLEEAGGNVTKALKLLDAGSKEIMVFHIKFSAEGKEDTGFMVAMFDMKSNSVTHSDMAYPMDKSMAGLLDIAMPPTVFASTIANVRGRMSDRLQSSSKSNNAQIRSKFSSSFIQAVSAMANKGQRDTVNEKFAKLIGEVMGETITVKSFSRLHSLDSVSSVLGGHGHVPNTPEEKAAALFVDQGSSGPLFDLEDLPNASPQEELPKIMLMCEPEISPFDGRPARELAEGDMVLVKIKDGRDSARYIAELLGGCMNDELLPMCVPIVKTNKMADTFVEAYVEFGPGIYGQFFIPPDVKIKTVDEDVELYDPFQNQETLFSDNRMGRRILFRMGLVLASAVALIVLFWQIRL